MKNDFTKTLSEMMEKLKYTNIDLANALNIKPTVISMIKNGKRLPTKPQYKLLDKYCGLSQVGLKEGLIDDISDMVNDKDEFELLQITKFIQEL